MNHLPLTGALPRPSQSVHSRARTLVCIAGPFTGKGETDEERKRATDANIARAAQLALAVAKLGAYPVCPHLNTSVTAVPEFEHAQPYEFWIEGTAEQLRRSDAILFTPDYLSSSGARGEERFAAEWGIPRFYTLSDLACWLLPGLAVASASVRPTLDTETEPQPLGAGSLAELAKTIPTLAPESSLADPFSDAFAAYEPPTGVECPHPGPHSPRLVTLSENGQ